MEGESDVKKPEVTYQPITGYGPNKEPNSNKLLKKNKKIKRSLGKCEF